jgi:hypothetical protein
MDTGLIFEIDDYISQEYNQPQKETSGGLSLQEFSINKITKAPKPFEGFPSTTTRVVMSISYEKKSSESLCFVYKILDYVLTRPLRLSVSYKDDGIMLENFEFDLWGYGETFDDAYASFVDFFKYDIESYKNTPTMEMDFFAQLEWMRYKSLLGIE